MKAHVCVTYFRLYKVCKYLYEDYLNDRHLSICTPSSCFTKVTTMEFLIICTPSFSSKKANFCTPVHSYTNYYSIVRAAKRKHNEMVFLTSRNANKHKFGTFFGSWCPSYSQECHEGKICQVLSIIPPLHWSSIAKPHETSSGCLELAVTFASRCLMWSYLRTGESGKQGLDTNQTYSRQP